MNKPNLKIVLATIFILGLTLGGIFGYRMAIGTYVGDIVELWVNPPFSEASYIIGVYNSTHYYAKNTTTGNYDYLDTDAKTVIQGCLTATRLAGGGLVFLRAGTYPLSDNLYVGANTTLQGESRGSVILIGFRPPNLGTWEAPIMNYGWASVAAENAVVKDLTINANQTGLSTGYRGIHFRPAIRNSVINVKLYNVSGWGVTFYGTNAVAPHDCLVSDCDISYCAYDCVEFVGEPGYGFTDGLALGNTLKHADGGVSCWNARQVSIIGNHFIDIDGCPGSATNHVAIPLQGDDGIGSKFITISGNTFSHENPTSVMHGISVLHGSTDITITGNVFNFWSSASHGYVFSIGNLPSYNVVFSGNLVLRNSVEATWCIEMKGENMLISNNIFTGNISSAPYLYCSALNNSLISNNQFRDCGRSFGAIYLTHSNYNKITDNMFLDSTGSAMETAIDVGWTTASHYNIITGNHIRNANQGITVETGCTHNKIEFNDIVCSVSNITDAGTADLIRWNVGYKTEASGNATILTGTTSIAWAHGLIAAPAYVFIQCTNSTVTVFPTVTKNVTHCIITGELGSGDYYVYAQTWNYP